MKCKIWKYLYLNAWKWVKTCCIFCNKMQIISILNDRSNDKSSKWSIQQEKMKIAALFIGENQLLWQLKWFQRYFVKLQFVRIQGLSGDSFKVFCYFVPLNFLSLTQTKYLFKSSSSKGKFVNFISFIVWIVFMFMFHCVSWLVMCDDSFFNNLFMVLHHKDFNRKRQFQI